VLTCKLCSRGPLPDALILETLASLYLLFPPNDRRTKSWLKKQRKSNRLDSQLGASGKILATERKTSKFRCWYSRLVVLNDEFEEAKPVPVSQWLQDVRLSKPGSRRLFWILVVFWGVLFPCLLFVILTVQIMHWRSSIGPPAVMVVGTTTASETSPTVTTVAKITVSNNDAVPTVEGGRL
jgi:hypothetical protein